jgi:hypothetical protein
MVFFYAVNTANELFHKTLKSVALVNFHVGRRKRGSYDFAT